MAGRPRIQIDNQFVQDMMDLYEVDSYTEIEEESGVSMESWRGWAKFRGSPLAALLMVKNLTETSGLDIDQLIEMVEAAEANRAKCAS